MWLVIFKSSKSLLEFEECEFELAIVIWFKFGLVTVNFRSAGRFFRESGGVVSVGSILVFLDPEKIFRVNQVIDEMISRLIVNVTVKRLVVHFDCIGDTL